MSYAETDLDMDLRFSRLVVKVEGASLSVWRGDNLLYRVDDVARLDVVCGISVCRLVAVTRGGDRVDVAYFTRRKEEFKRFADSFNKGAKFVVERERVEKPSVGTLKWLWSILSKY
ncbi:MAG: hypothetical protein QW320_00035, partial [Ignisphaera sp.]